MMFIATTGIDPQTVLWSGVGAVIGNTLAPPVLRGAPLKLLHAWAMFAAVVLAGAELGTWAAHIFNDDARVARNAWAMGFAGLFYPLFDAFVRAIPALFAAFIRARTGGNT